MATHIPLLFQIEFRVDVKVPEQNSFIQTLDCSWVDSTEPFEKASIFVADSSHPPFPSALPFRSFKIINYAFPYTVLSHFLITVFFRL